MLMYTACVCKATTLTVEMLTPFQAKQRAIPTGWEYKIASGGMYVLSKGETVLQIRLPHDTVTMQ